jgi:hypothetical protein
VLQMISCETHAMQLVAMSNHKPRVDIALLACTNEVV